MSASPPTRSPAEPAGGHRSLAWFFGYGSLMWRPGFLFEACEVATLDGWHRALCIYSHHYRGTATRPGLVLGLAPGGHCVGLAFGVERVREAEVMSYLDDRELMSTYVYERTLLPLRLLSDGRTVEAWCYVAIPGHEQFAGDLDQDAVLACVRQGQGAAGTCADYVRNTAAHLREIGIAEPGLEALVERLGT